MNHTTNYNLPQWEATDAVKREDVNGAMATVDAALKTVSDAAANVPEIVFGTYTGDGQESQTIYLGRKPKVVYVEPQNGVRYSSFGPYGGIAGQGSPGGVGFDIYLSLTDDGFIVYFKSSGSTAIYTNYNNLKFHYFAIC